MEPETPIGAVERIMDDFAERTGITNRTKSPQRYLWTDAHAVCNFLSLYKKTRNDDYLDLALRLVDQVHHVLGKHRQDDSRHGWISGLWEEEGQRHPTAGGLRIGKRLNERGPDDPFNKRLEWDRDGQYFHYLTKWMHALYRVSVVTNEPQYCRWATELAKAAHAGFAKVLRADGTKGLAWKMSIDLSYPLMPSSGLHDPLDAFVTYNQLGMCTSLTRDAPVQVDLTSEIAEVATMNEGQRWATNDSLGIGGLLFDTNRALQLIAASRPVSVEFALLLISETNRSLVAFRNQSSLGNRPESRLAFRELGLSIGLNAIAIMRRVVDSRPDVFGAGVTKALDELSKYAPLSPEIERFWSDPLNQRASSWQEHLNINSIMLATSLLPDEFLLLSAG